MIRVPYIKVLALTDDFLFATTDVAIWSTVESGLGIVAAGGACLRPLFRSFYSLSTHRSTNKQPSRHYNHQNRKNSIRLESGQESMVLRNDIGEGVITSVGSPFGDEYLVGDGESVKGGGKGIGGIRVLKTVEISRRESEAEGSASTSTRPGTGRSETERDLV
jgi:hypothetical protein